MKYKRLFYLGENDLLNVHLAIEKYIEEEKIQENCVVTYAFAHYTEPQKLIEGGITIDKIDNVCVITELWDKGVFLGGKDISRERPELLLIYGHTLVSEVVIKHGVV